MKGPPVSSATHHTEYCAFKRECMNPKRYPKEVLPRWEDRVERAQLFQDWFYNGKSLKDLQLKYRKVEVFKKRLRESMSFKTYDDLLVLFHGKSDAIDELVAKKTRLGHYRAHPEFPRRADMVQYWVKTSTETLVGTV